MTALENLARVEAATHVFTPRQAIKTADHLAGRKQEIGKVIAATFAPGAHAVIYGERGVGKNLIGELRCATHVRHAN